MRQIWIDQVLDELVPGGVHLQIHASADVGPPSDSTSPGGMTEPVPIDSLVNLFDQSGRALLILGEPGSGKTVSLLDLARELVERAEADPAQPVPVVFKLASWSSGRPLSEWFVDELSAFYRVPRRQSRRWIRERRILPLLDGLDEVGPASLTACVRAINQHIGEGVPGIALTCRTQAYSALSLPLDVNAGFRVGLLTHEQVLDHVDRSGAELVFLARILREDAILLEMARTPLMLRLIVEAYRNLTDADVRRDDLLTTERRREHVLDTFAQRAFERAKERSEGDPPFDEDEVASGLSFVASGLRRHSESILLVDRLQPSWLREKSWRLLYVATTRLTGGLLIGLVFGVLLEAGLTLIGGGIGPFLAEALNRIGFGGMIGLTGGTMVASIDLVRYRRGRGDLRIGKPYLILAVYLILFALLGLAVIGVVGGSNFLYGLATGVAWGIVFWLFFGLPAHHRRLRSDIQMPESLRFSTTSASRHAARGALLGAAVGAAVESLIGLGEAMDPTTRVLSIMLAAVALAAPAAVIGGVVGGLQRGYVLAPPGPREGVRLALRNMALAGSAVALAATIVLAPLLWLGVGGVRGAALGIVAGPFVGVLAALWMGGLDVLRHSILVSILARSSPVARRLVPFLDYSAELGFLQRAGGGYLFIHNVLLDYFAAMDPLDEVESPEWRSHRDRPVLEGA